MNCIAAYAVPVPLGYHAMCRFSHNAKPWPIMENEKPKVYPDRTEALIAAQQHVIDHINGTLRRSGVTLSAALSEAEALFKPILHRAGKRPVVVERVRAKA